MSTTASAGWTRIASIDAPDSTPAVSRGAIGPGRPKASYMIGGDWAAGMARATGRAGGRFARGQRLHDVANAVRLAGLEQDGLADRSVSVEVELDDMLAWRDAQAL